MCSCHVSSVSLAMLCNGVLCIALLDSYVHLYVPFMLSLIVYAYRVHILMFLYPITAATWSWTFNILYCRKLHSVRQLGRSIDESCLLDVVRVDYVRYETHAPFVHSSIYLNSFNFIYFATYACICPAWFHSLQSLLLHLKATSFNMCSILRKLQQSVSQLLDRIKET